LQIVINMEEEEEECSFIKSLTERNDMTMITQQGDCHALTQDSTITYK